MELRARNFSNDSAEDLLSVMNLAVSSSIPGTSYSSSTVAEYKSISKTISRVSIEAELGMDNTRVGEPRFGAEVTLKVTLLVVEGPGAEEAIGERKGETRDILPVARGDSVCLCGELIAFREGDGDGAAPVR